MVRVGTARQRLVERLSASANLAITLLIAPAGYGKSVALRQYLQQCTEPRIHFGLRPEHGTLLGFLRGFAEAARPVAPHAITTLAGAYERNQTSPKRTADLAQWMQVHLESFEGVIAIDDLHVADNDEDIGRFLASLIDSSKERIRWIIASRSTANLPVASWVTYRDADLPIGERDLRLTLEEARTAAIEFESTIGDEELRDLLELTEGWPAAMSFALRTSTRSSDLRNVSAVTREMIYRFLAEQVYETLDEEERALLEVAITLPEIDVDVLERAGFDRALQIVERLRERTAFVHEERPGAYHCHDLFRDFLRHQNALTGKRAQQSAHERAGRALEGGGDIEHAITAYVAAAARSDVVRLLEHHGFDLLERARGDLVSNAIEALDEVTRRENATVLALLGALQATAGKFTRAESLFRRALARACENTDLVAIASLRLAVMMANEGRDVRPVLSSVCDDVSQSAGHKAEARSLIAGQQAVSGERTASFDAAVQAQQMLIEVDADVTRAKVLHRIGIAYHHLGEAGKASDALSQSAELAEVSSSFGLQSRAYAVLSNLVLHEYDDVTAQLRYAEAAAKAAEKAGDAFALQTALLQMLSAEMRKGDVDRSIAIERRLMVLKPSEMALKYLSIFRAWRLAWESRFDEAQRLLGPTWMEMDFSFDRASCGAKCGAFAALEGRREEALAIVEQALALSKLEEPTTLFKIRSNAITRVFCAITEAICGRVTHGQRIIRSLRASRDNVVSTVTGCADAVLSNVAPVSVGGAERFDALLDRLEVLQYADIARILQSIHGVVAEERSGGPPASGLTPSEIDVLRFLEQGLLPKEIAERTSRSVYTVRVHIANAIAKLGCHGHSEAVRMARRFQLI